MALRLVVALALLPAGVVVAVAAAAVHALWWGLPLGVATTVAVLWALPDRWWGRLPFGLAWAATVVVLADLRPEGDLVIRSNTAGYVLLATALGALVAGVLSLRPSRVSQREDSDSRREAS